VTIGVVRGCRWEPFGAGAAGDVGADLIGQRDGHAPLLKGWSGHSCRRCQHVPAAWLPSALREQDDGRVAGEPFTIDVHELT
jgi:hypothetical protein